MDEAFQSPQMAARALLGAAWAGDARLTRKAASFAGQTSIATEPLTKGQVEWLSVLLERAKLSALVCGVAQ